MLQKFKSWLRSRYPPKTHYPDFYIQSICFGVFCNYDGWSSGNAYKVTQTGLQIDTSGSYWNERFEKKGYTFSGAPVEIDESLQQDLNLLRKFVPIGLRKLQLPKISEPGNKEEYTIYIEVKLNTGPVIKFEVNEADPSHVNLDPAILDFKYIIKRWTRKIEEYLRRTDQESLLSYAGPRYYQDSYVQSISFGLFCSYSLSIGKAYKLTRTGLQLDTSDTFWSKRFDRINGYSVNGLDLHVDGSMQQKLNELFSLVPSRLRHSLLPQIWEPGNKDEHVVFIQVEFTTAEKVTFELNDCESSHANQDPQVLEFRDTIKVWIKMIEEYLMTTG